MLHLIWKLYMYNQHYWGKNENNIRYLDDDMIIQRIYKFVSSCEIIFLIIIKGFYLWLNIQILITNNGSLYCKTIKSCILPIFNKWFCNLLKTTCILHMYFWICKYYFVNKRTVENINLTLISSKKYICCTRYKLNGCFHQISLVICLSIKVFWSEC